MVERRGVLSTIARLGCTLHGALRLTSRTWRVVPYSYALETAFASSPFIVVLFFPGGFCSDPERPE
jgi:hypothetical protein